MKNIDYPPKDDTATEENLKDIAVESFEDTREIKNNLEDQKILEEKERAFEIPAEKQERIEEIREKIKADHIAEIQAVSQRKPLGDEQITLSPEYKHIPEAKHVKGFRKFLFGLTAMLGLAGAAKAEGGKNPEKDSLARAQMEQTIKSIENSQEVNDVIRADWNDFSEWLKPQGLQGNEALDHNGLGMKKLREYVESHPGTSLKATAEGVKQVQAEFIKYRKWVLNEVKAGRAKLSAGTTESNFMSWLSKYDGIPGQFTTRSQFPGAKEIKTETTTVNWNKIGNEAIKQGKETGDLGGSIKNVKSVDEKVTITNKGFAKIGKDFTNRDDTIGLPGTEIAKNK